MEALLQAIRRWTRVTRQPPGEGRAEEFGERRACADAVPDAEAGGEGRGGGVRWLEETAEAWFLHLRPDAARRERGPCRDGRVGANAVLNYADAISNYDSPAEEVLQCGEMARKVMFRVYRRLGPHAAGWDGAGERPEE